MSENVDAIIKDGIRAYKAKKMAEARELFEKATELDSYNEQAWLWLSACVDTEEDKRVCLENVIFINPDNAAAQKGLAQLTPVTSDSDAESTSETMDATPPTATSSASSGYTPDEPSSQEYDEWVSSLNINESNQPASNNPFTTMDFDDDEAIFANAFSDDFEETEEEDGDIFGDPFGDDPFSASGDIEVDETDFGSSDIDGPFDSSIFDTGLDDFSVGTSNEEVRASKEEKVDALFTSDASSSTDSLFMEDIDTTTTSTATEPDSMFRTIPASIKPTSLPGTPEKAPVPMLIGVIVLILLNLGALALLATKFVG